MNTLFIAMEIAFWVMVIAMVAVIGVGVYRAFKVDKNKNDSCSD